MHIVLSGKSQDEIYRDLNRWLVKYYVNPEEILKAKIHGEYLRGDAYEPQVITSGPLTRADLHYTFVAKISENTLTFTLSNAVLVSPGGQDADVDQGGTHRVEDFFHNDAKKKSKPESEKILVALNDFSGSLLNSLGDSFRTPQN